MVLKGNATSFLISRVNYRSYSSAHVCFRFRYAMYGKDVESLMMYVRYDNGSELIQVWFDRDSTSSKWKYGQVQITSMADFQVKYILTY